jgi:hypothetical protein
VSVVNKETPCLHGVQRTAKVGGGRPCTSLDESCRFHPLESIINEHVGSCTTEMKVPKDARPRA